MSERQQRFCRQCSKKCFGGIQHSKSFYAFCPYSIDYGMVVNRLGFSNNDENLLLS